MAIFWKILRLQAFTPPLTYILCKDILQGTRKQKPRNTKTETKEHENRNQGTRKQKPRNTKTETKKRKDLLDRSASLLAQHMVQALKTDYKASYEQRIRALILELQKRHHYQLQCQSLFTKR